MDFSLFEIVAQPGRPLAQRIPAKLGRGPTTKNNKSLQRDRSLP
jgi:hypothetical protein